MEKKYFYLKLIPCRPSFAMDMNDEERAIMEQHVKYWKKLMDNDVALVFGPVLDPAGAYGVGIISVESQEQAKKITSNDPASRINSYEVYPMMAMVKS